MADDLTDAQKQDLETLAAQDAMVPVPSQEEADRVCGGLEKPAKRAKKEKEVEAEPAGTYKTRQAKAD